MAFTNKKIAFFVFLVFIASVFAGTYNVIDSYLTVETAPENTDSQANGETTTISEESSTEETVATPVQEKQPAAEEPEAVVKKYGKENHGAPVDERTEVRVRNKITSRMISGRIMVYDIFTEVTNTGAFDARDLIVQTSSEPEGRTIYFTPMHLESLEVDDVSVFHTRIFVDDMARVKFHIAVDGDNLDRVELEETGAYHRKKSNTPTINHPVAKVKIDVKPTLTAVMIQDEEGLTI